MKDFGFKNTLVFTMLAKKCDFLREDLKYVTIKLTTSRQKMDKGKQGVKTQNLIIQILVIFEILSLSLGTRGAH